MQKYFYLHLLKTLVFALSMLGSSLVIAAQGFELSGFAPGMKVSKCPSNFDTEVIENFNKSSFDCLSKTVSGSNQKKLTVVQVFDNEVVAVIVNNIGSRAQWTEIVTQLSQAYGQPNRSSEGFSWRRAGGYFVHANAVDDQFSIISGHLPSIQKAAAAAKAGVKQ